MLERASSERMIRYKARSEGCIKKYTLFQYIGMLGGYRIGPAVTIDK